MDKLKEEILQTKELRQQLLLRILNSKRLLSDHVDTLEECIADHFEVSKTRFVTFNKLIGLCVSSGVIYVHIKSNRFANLLPLICSSYGVFYTKKLLQAAQNNQVLQKLHVLLQRIDEFEANIKKNILFLNERAVLKGSAKADNVKLKDKQILENCFTTMLEIILTIYKDLKVLEEAYRISEKYETIYQPFENIEDCDLLKVEITELKLNNVKDFYNIFAYIQSQYLFRLGLVVFHGKAVDCKAISCRFLQTLSSTLAEKSSQLTKLIEVKAVDSNQLTKIETSVSLPAPLVDLRKSSIQFSMKMTALLHEFQELDSSLQSFLLVSPDENFLKSELSTLQSTFKVIATELPVLQDDYQRLFINYKRFLNVAVEPLLLALPPSEPEKPGKVYSVDTVEQQADDFFAVDGFSDSDASEEERNNEQDFENVNAKVAKRYFQPVLKQLKQKIEPLGEAMKERERKVLQAKGIEVVEADNLKEQARDSYSDSDDDDYASKRRRQRKLNKNDNRYNDARDFLASKEQANMFMKLLPRPAVVTEDVLE